MSIVNALLQKSCGNNAKIVCSKWSCDWEITLTLLPSQYEDSPEIQYISLLKELKKLKRLFSFKLSLCAELTGQSNIHAHGFIKVREREKGTLRAWINDIFRKNTIIGRIYIKPYDDFNIWKDYCLKDKWDTEKDIFCNPVMYDDFNYFQSFQSDRTKCPKK